ncbi:MAG: GAF domain-containing protein [Chloroflexi bacterium]|nr:GAF domain-containing protein [Chloroflexota bacterium]
MSEQLADLIKQAVNDPDRLARLHSLNLLDTEVEEAFDRLTRLASRITGCPVSLVSLVDADRQFFKSMFGLTGWAAEDQQTPLSHSFCKHVVATGDVLAVDDAREHPDLKDNLAIPDLNVIGYLGIPLTTSDGFELGSFCVIDSQPRTWEPHEVEIIRELAVSVMTEIELRAQMLAREQAERELTERNRKYQRVYRFASSTLDRMQDLIEHRAAIEEFDGFVQEMRRELSRLD